MSQKCKQKKVHFIILFILRHTLAGYTYNTCRNVSAFCDGGMFLFSLNIDADMRTLELSFYCLSVLSLCFLFTWSCWMISRLFWTELLGGIQHSRCRHVQTLHLSSELLHLLLLQLPPSAEQVKMLLPLRDQVDVHHQAVATGCVGEVCGDVAFICPVIGEAATLQGNVVGVILALVF